jgi:hypothetical protein
MKQKPGQLYKQTGFYIFYGINLILSRVQRKRR